MEEIRHNTQNKYKSICGISIRSSDDVMWGVKPGVYLRILGIPCKSRNGYFFPMGKSGLHHSGEIRAYKFYATSFRDIDVCRIQKKFEVQPFRIFLSHYSNKVKFEAPTASLPLPPHAYFG